MYSLQHFLNLLQLQDVLIQLCKVNVPIIVIFLLYMHTSSLLKFIAREMMYVYSIYRIDGLIET